MSSHHKSIIRESLDRLHEKMAISSKRREAKNARRAAGEQSWTYPTERMHSYKTRSAYQEHILHFVTWARATYNVKSLSQLDPRADELACVYLQKRLDEQKSPYTVQAERSALRLFFGDRRLAIHLVIPERRRENIVNSRKATVREREFQPANWQPLIRFLQATGLRRDEVRLLQVEDIWRNPTRGRLEVAIKKGHGKGGRPRSVPVLPGHEAEVRALVEGRDPQERVFPRIASHLRIHVLRREYAQAYYQFLSGRELPPTIGRLKRSAYDEAAVLEVSQALGHNRKDVVLRHYLR